MMDENFWLEFISRTAFHASRTELKDYDAGKSADSDLPEAIRTLNDKRQHWQKAVLSYETPRSGGKAAFPPTGNGARPGKP